jgi:hypothetical protein
LAPKGLICLIPAYKVPTKLSAVYKADLALLASILFYVLVVLILLLSYLLDFLSWRTKKQSWFYKTKL